MSPIYRKRMRRLYKDELTNQVKKPLIKRPIYIMAQP